MKYTHKGWLGFCPVVVANPRSNCPDVDARPEFLMPVLRFNVWLQELAIGFCSLVAPDYEPSWKIRITGKL